MHMLGLVFATRQRAVAVVVLILLISVAVPAAAQDIVVTGRVVSGSSKQPVSGATLAAGSTRVTTDAEGRFSIHVARGRATIDVSAVGFLAQTLTIDAAPDLAPLEVVLATDQRVREEVTVLGSAGAQAGTPAALDVAPTKVLNVPGAWDNIFKALQTLPGVNGTDDFGSRLSVRGGGPDQNLTMMDGVEIHNPYRLFGLTSAFNPEIIDRFELTAGGFDTKYGDRLSSILLVDNRPGTDSRTLAGSAAMSVTDTNVVLEGKLPGAAKGSWLASGRRTYYDLVADHFAHTHLPTFNDIQTKAVWEPKPTQRLSFFGLRSRERTDLQFTDDNDHLQVGDDSKNDLASVSYAALVRGRVSLRTVGAWYDYRDALDVDGAFDDDSRTSNATDKESVRRAAVVFTRDLGVLDRSVRQEAQWSAGRHLFDTGVEAHALRTTWGWRIAGDRNAAAANDTSVEGGEGLPSFLQSTKSSTRAGAWAQDRLSFGQRAHVVAGVRIDRGGLADRATFSPRASLDLTITRSTRLRAAIGRYSQSPGYEKLLQADYFVDLSAAATLDVKSERATHVLAALDHSLTSAVTFRAEAYTKRLTDLIVGRLETPAETEARVARYIFPGTFADSVPRSPKITTEPVNGGSGLAYGFDVYLEKRPRSANDRLSGWMSYTWSRAMLDAYGVQRPFDYDRRHAFSLVSTLRLRPRIDLGTSLRIASGFPATVPVGVRVAAEDLGDSDHHLIPMLDDKDRPVWTADFGGVENLSRSRLPVFARLDLRVTFKPKTPQGHWVAYIEILNVTKRRNVGGYTPELQVDRGSDRPRVVLQESTGLPLVPSFGVRFHF